MAARAGPLETCQLLSPGPPPMTGVRWSRAAGSWRRATWALRDRQHLEQQLGRRFTLWQFRTAFGGAGRARRPFFPRHRAVGAPGGMFRIR
eukprot:2484792-Alexandrium_andersonii.AAC.1